MSSESWMIEFILELQVKQWLAFWVEILQKL